MLGVVEVVVDLGVLVGFGEVEGFQVVLVGGTDEPQEWTLVVGLGIRYWLESYWVKFR